MSDRQQFEYWITQEPMARDISRWPDNPDEFAWPGQYTDNAVEIAWQAWQTATKWKTENP